MAVIAEYIWIDGTEPTPLVRSKTKILPNQDEATLDNLPEWTFDGSSTNQAPGNDSDRILRPVRVVPDPIRGDGAYLVLCEVFNPDGTVNRTNYRAALREAMDAGGTASEPWVSGRRTRRHPKTLAWTTSSSRCDGQETTRRHSAATRSASWSSVCQLVVRRSRTC